MDIENLSKNIKTKLLKNSSINNVEIEDKTYLHLKHTSHEKNKFHIKLIIFSEELKQINKLNSTKKIYKILDEEIKKYLHSIQILIK
tara:strand:+ start:322 stop:582 length:261 start_codon:yes stop_codon:yes gene_type:complete